MTHGEVMSTDFQQALYDAVAASYEQQERGRIHRHAAELDRGATLPDDDRDEHDGPLFLVVTIKPRLDRLAEAEAQLQSMRKNTLTEPGCVFMHFLASSR